MSELLDLSIMDSFFESVTSVFLTSSLLRKSFLLPVETNDENQKKVLLGSFFRIFLYVYTIGCYLHTCVCTLYLLQLRLNLNASSSV